MDTSFFNSVKLIVTSNRHYELDAASEIWHCIRATHISENPLIYFPKFGKEWIRGLIFVSFEGNALSAVEKIREYLELRPWIMEYMQRIIPVEFVSEDIESVKNFIREVAPSRIGPNDRWMIKVTKRASNFTKREIIHKIAAEIERGIVDLENPKWIINIEIIKNMFLTSIINKHHIIRKKELKEKVLKSKENDSIFI